MFSNLVNPTESDNYPLSNELPILEVSGGVSGSKDGRGIGDLVDGRTIEVWVREYLLNRGTPSDVDELCLLKAFRFGVRNEGRYAGQSFIDAEPEIRSEWCSERDHPPWDSVRDAIWAGFDRGRDRKL
jgi:hypothetical protein